MEPLTLKQVEELRDAALERMQQAEAEHEQYKLLMDKLAGEMRRDRNLVLAMLGFLVVFTVVVVLLRWL